MAALAQDSATAVLVGRVADASHSPIAGAHVKATREGTGVVREATTGASGNYVLPSLGPGAYGVEVEAPGFAVKTSRVRVEVGSRVTLDATLDVSGKAEVVTVEDLGGGLEATSTVVGGIVSSTAIENLPLNGRNFLELAFLVPGNAPAPNFDPTKTNSVAVSSAGQLGRGGNITIDGQDNNDDVVGGPLANLPQDAVQEFQIATNRFSAEQGRSAASAINVVTKSGSDALRGLGLLLLARRRPAGAARHLRPHPRPGAALRPRAVLRDARRARSSRARPGGSGPRSTATRTRSCRSATRDVATRTIRRELRRRRRSTTSWPRAASTCARLGQGRRSSFRYVVRGRGRHRGQHARPRDRLRQPAPGEPTTATTWASAPGRARSRRTVREHAARELQRLRNDDRPRDARPPAHLPEHPGRGELPRAPGHDPEALAVHRLAVPWCGAPTRFGSEGRSRTPRATSTWASSATAASSSSRTSPQFDLNRDGRVDDNDLLFAVTLRSGKPDQNLLLDNCSSTYLAGLRPGRLARSRRSSP